MQTFRCVYTDNLQAFVYRHCVYHYAVALEGKPSYRWISRVDIEIALPDNLATLFMLQVGGTDINRKIC